MSHEHDYSPAMLRLLREILDRDADGWVLCNTPNGWWWWREGVYDDPEPPARWSIVGALASRGALTLIPKVGAHHCRLTDKGREAVREYTS